MAKNVLPNPISLIVFDFDGVFTNGKVCTDQNGIESVMCDRRDGLGLDALRAKGIPTMILSTETNLVVKARAAKLRLPVAQACADKATFLAAHLTEFAIDPIHVVYVGDDINDLAAMRLIGCAVAPSDAHPAVKAIAALVLSARGGDGAVREICDLITE